MSKRRRFKHSTSLKERLASFAKEVRAKASRLPPGVERDTLLKKASQADTATHLDEWACVKSPYSGLISGFLASVARRWNGWLTSQDSNSHIPNSKSTFEMSKEFRPIPVDRRRGDFRVYLPEI
jgi:hypothetical protein